MENIMREIKFRCWSVSSESMDYINPKHPDGWTLSAIKSSGTWKVMQFTGLTDKNGKEIYEGDIVKHHETKGYDCLSVGAIIYDDCKAQYSHSSYSEEYLTGNCLEVIGNIYENPELLEANDD